MLNDDNYLKPDNINWSNKTLLIVDDDKLCSELIQEMLAKTRINIRKAQTGQEAILLIQSFNNIDIILLDVRLPKMDGFEVYERIREINQTVPVVAHTAFYSDDILNYTQMEKFNSVLLKPICIEDLFDLLNKYLKPQI